MPSFPVIADAAAGSDALPPGGSLGADRGGAGSTLHPLPATQPGQSTTLDRTPREMRLTGWTPQSKRMFLEALARCGNVRNAAAFVSMSREGAYQLRRRDRAFALAWEGALVQARELAEDVLQDKALNGIVEQLSYHGEVVDTRTRFDGRLLLALLGRLDKRAESRAAALGAERFDDLLHAIGAGEDAGALLEAPEADARSAGAGVAAGSGVGAAAEEEDPHLIWEQDGEWWTDYPPPPDFDGYEQGCYGDEDYSRSLSEEELEAIGDEEAADERLARAEAQRRAAFGLDGAEAGGDGPHEKAPLDSVKPCEAGGSRPGSPRVEDGHPPKGASPHDRHQCTPSPHPPGPAQRGAEAAL
ncbi:hypothetical protein [Novosphingopyxis sp. YJ-S2-01]|uniref:hypothetical protein n=1 Tax=Novosphingopyxis sp. YJ-S2-01 TaxID=2794021 RepID=UPI0018DD8E65|nr:hypothetical protein [Novosphingopyxis sp. YJ-S2-01]MBH9537774.1 hypothetical protein [Novosphingopyxis sp. YJ-S2-01]